MILELYVGWRLCLCKGWPRWEIHPDGSSVLQHLPCSCCRQAAPTLPHPIWMCFCLLYPDSWLGVELCTRGGRSLVLGHRVEVLSLSLLRVLCRSRWVTEYADSYSIFLKRLDWSSPIFGQWLPFGKDARWTPRWREPAH